MPVSDAVLQRLAQIEQELTTALTEYPSENALDRLKYVRALVRFVKTQIGIDDDATIPVLDSELEPSARRTPAAK